MNNKQTIEFSKERAPFVALIEFKEDFLFQNKHKKFAFRSDVIAKNKNLLEQYEATEKLLKKFEKKYWSATIFDNRREAENLVIVKEFNNVMIVDNRINLAFLNPVPKQNFIEFMIEKMKQQRREYAEFKHNTKFGKYSENDLRNNIINYKKMLSV